MNENMMSNWQIAWLIAQEAKKARNIELVDKACAEVLAINPDFWFARELPKHARGYYAQIGQDAIIENFFLNHPAKSKIFVDIGAFDGVHYSNVRRLQEQYGWTGICIEPVRKNYEKLQKSYRGTSVKCVRAAVSDVEGEMEINVATYPHLPEWGSDIATFSTTEMKRWKQYEPQWQKELVPVQKLTTILVQQGVQYIDFLSVDTEGNDLKAIQSFDLHQFQPTLIMVEYGNNREEIISYLSRLGYSVLLDNAQDLFMARIDHCFRDVYPELPATINYAGLTGIQPYDEIQEEVETKLYEFVCKPVIDIRRIVIVGGYLGFEIDRILQRYPKAEVHVFEASPRYFYQLSKRFVENSRVFCYNYAVSDENGTALFHEVTLEGTGSLLPMKTHEDDQTWIAPNAEPAEHYSVSTVTLDSFAPLAGQPIDLLWIDVQGAEIKILKGAKQTLRRCHALFLEVWTYKTMYKGQCTLDEIEKYLAEYSFYLSSIGLDQGGNGTGNSFWLRTSPIAENKTLLSEKPQKIVALIPVRNESRHIAFCLRAVAKFADAICVSDEASDDNTVQIIELLAVECRVERIIKKEAWKFNETQRRQPLLDAGREIGGTHFIVFDADEAFTSNLADNNFLRGEILKLKPGERLELVWIQLWRSVKQFRYDTSVWTNNYKAFIFADDSQTYYHEQTFHLERVPSNLYGTSYRFDGYKFGVLHLQFLNWRNLLTKQAWYRCLERIMHPQKSVQEINALYAPSKDETNIGLRNSLPEWFSNYEFFDKAIYDAPEQWREKQVLQWFEQYGREYFAELDIWNIDWGGGVAKLHDSTASTLKNITHDSITADEAAKIQLRSTVSVKVSVIVSTYNSERFIRGCLESLVNQTLYKKGEIEILVIDSNSEQSEQAIVQEFQARYPNIFYIRTLERETLYAAWNRGIQVARGQYITSANTDDRHRPDALKIMANYLDMHPKAALVYADQLITTIANDTWDTTQADRCWNWPPFSYSELERRCIIGPQPMWKKSLHEKYGYFRSEFTCAGDYEFWLRIGKTEEIVCLPEILGLYYYNPHGLEHGASTLSRQETHRIWDEYGILYGTAPSIPDISFRLVPAYNYNLIVFPDWSRPQESLGLELEKVIKALVTHPDKGHMTLLIEASNIADEDANLILSGVMMSLLMQEDLDVEAGPEVSLVGPLVAMQWEALLPRLRARIVLEHENQQVIAAVKAETLPTCELNSFSLK